MAVGSALGRLSHEIFPEGVLVESHEGGKDAAVAETKRLIKEGHAVLFEASFAIEGLHARCDILERTEGGWAVTEVKSSTKVKDDHYEDLAFQVYVLRHCGLEVVRASLCHVNTGAVKQEGEVRPQELFKVSDVTKEVMGTLPFVADWIRDIQAVLAGESAPEIRTNTHCSNPVKCAFYVHCHADQPEHDITFLPGIRRAAVVSFRELGVETIPDIPESAKLTPDQARARDVIRFNEPFLSTSLKTALEEVTFPAHFIDFEAANPAIPLYPGHRPYQAFPFQWSDHTLDRPISDPEHADFLHTDSSDPRLEFAETLLDRIRGAATVVYYSSYEMTTVKSLARDGVPAAAELTRILDNRGFDLLKVIQQYVYFAEFKGSFSIKKVLPAIVPSLDYSGLAIADGDTAAIEYLRMVSNGTNPVEKAQIASDLREYCKRDTLAMVELYRALVKLAG